MARLLIIQLVRLGVAAFLLTMPWGCAGGIINGIDPSGPVGEEREVSPGTTVTAISSLMANASVLTSGEYRLYLHSTASTTPIFIQDDAFQMEDALLQSAVSELSR